MIIDIFKIGMALWLLYMVMEGIRTDHLYARISPSDENIYIIREKTPVMFWFFSTFYLCVALLLIWSVFFAENAA